MASNETGVISRGISLSKKVITCMFLRKKMVLEEDEKLTGRVYFQDLLFVVIGAVLSNFYHGMPAVTSKHGYMIFFPLLLSGMMTVITSLCFAELVAINPNSGGIYRYVYYIMGELMAFLVGWGLIASCIIDLVFRVSIITPVIDEILFNGQVENFTLTYLPLGGFQNYFIRILPNAKIENIFVLLSITVVIVFNYRCGKVMFHSIAILNLLIMTICLIIFWFYMDLSKFNILRATDDFKFFTDGALQGLSFYKHYEVVIHFGAEAVNPTKTIPAALVEGVQFGFMFYMFTVILFSSRERVKKFPMPAMKNAFQNLGFKNFAKFIPLGFILTHFIGGLIELFMGNRLIYTMSRDGLMFPIFGHVHEKFKTPLMTHVIIMIVSSIVSVFIGIAPSTKHVGIALETLVRIMGLLAYLFQRYSCESDDLCPERDEEHQKRWVLANFPNPLSTPTKTSQTISMWLIFLSVICVTTAELILVYYIIGNNNKQLSLRLCFFFSLFIGFIAFQLLTLQPINDRKHFAYKARGVPYTPILAINWYTLVLMILPQDIWIKIFCWFIIGLFFYFSYACLRSKEYEKKKETESFAGISS